MAQPVEQERIRTMARIPTSVSSESFPVKLHRALCEIECMGMSDVACWSPHGRSFVVHKPLDWMKVLSRYVHKFTSSRKSEPLSSRLFRRSLQRWFQQTKFTSFQRQLNIYDFRRMTAGKCSFDG
jgi:HSF-type DNA-binding